MNFFPKKLLFDALPPSNRYKRVYLGKISVQLGEKLMNQKSRKEKHKYSNEEKLVLGEDENTNALIDIAQEDDSNIFDLLQNL